MELRYDYLPRDEKIIRLVATWQFDAFGAHDRRASYTRTLGLLQERIESRRVPLCLVAWEGAEPVGTLSIIDDDLPTHPEWKPWLADLVVAPAHRGRGLGTALFKRAEEEFRRLGAGTGYLFTWDHEAMYTRLGWQTFLTEPYREDLVAIMKRDFKDRK